MKGFKKLLTGILAATMIMGASLTAFAADNASITITNENNNTGDASEITYTYYQIMKADVLSVTNDGAAQSGTAAYYVESEALAEALKATGYFTYTKSATENRWNISLDKNVADTTDLGNKIVEKLNTVTFIGDGTENNKGLAITSGTVKSTKNADGKFASATIPNLDPGYYLVLSSLGTKAAVQTLGNVTINEKNEYPTVTKKDNKEVDSMYDETPILYTIEVKVPANPAAKDIKVVDTATKGLTLNKTVTATVDNAALATYTWSDGVAVNDEKGALAAYEYSLTIPAATVTANAGKTIKLEYTAVINKDAVVLVPETNDAYIVYDNYSSAKTKKEDVVTLGFELLKQDETTKKSLTGAEFTLWTAETNGEQIHLVYDDVKKLYRKASAEEITAMTDENGVVKSTNVVVDAAGKATIVGLDAKTYYLQEEVAPTGYNKLTSRKSLTLSKSNELQQVTVFNNSGSVLPSTGGMGTTIFYILGGVLIMAGVAYFMVRRKADAE
jgi:fimbrial isopeptide formation D2 family protein/LPXTG-motif cell wall-anchored protein